MGTGLRPYGGRHLWERRRVHARAWRMSPTHSSAQAAAWPSRGRTSVLPVTDTASARRDYTSFFWGKELCWELCEELQINYRKQAISSIFNQKR